VPPIRQRNLTRIALGVVVLAISTLGVVSLRSDASATRSVLVVTRAVAAGERVRGTDVRRVQVPAAIGAQVVSATDLGDVVGRIARTTLVDGSLLSPGQLTTDNADSDTAVVGATLKDGQFPTTLTVGDRVLVVTAATSSAGIDEAAPRSARGVVIDLADAPDTSATVVSLRVPLEVAPTFAAAGGDGHVSLVSVEP
jgi:hypothetical protein